MPLPNIRQGEAMGDNRRRAFVQRALMFGSMPITFWIVADDVHAQNAECTLPTSSKAERFIPKENKVVVRLSASEIGESSRAPLLRAFRMAVNRMRGLAPTEVVSWTKYVAQHCLSCDPSNTNNIHYNWQFLPWHRALLYFQERLLRTFSKNDDLRIVYWDWERPASRTLPVVYAAENQPLHWANRNLSGPRWPLDDPRVDVQPLLAVPTFEIFGGTATRQQPVPASFSGPHAGVHNAFNPSDMADLRFSPRDPVFYAHHANIDRLWSSWVAAGHQNPDFADSRAYFYDENKKWRYILFNDLRDERRLGYRYSTLMQPVTAITRLRAFPMFQKDHRFGFEAKVLTQMKAQDDGRRFLILRNIRNLDELPKDALEFGVFGAKPEAGTRAAADKSFLGNFSRVMSRDHAHAAPLSAAITLQKKLEESMRGDGSVELTMAALDAEGRTRGSGIVLRADAVIVMG